MRVNNPRRHHTVIGLRFMEDTLVFKMRSGELVSAAITIEWYSVSCWQQDRKVAASFESVSPGPVLCDLIK